MKRFLLPTPSKVTRFYLRTLAVLLFAVGVAAPAHSQCIGPYQFYESFGPSTTKATMIANGWQFSSITVTPGNTGSIIRSGMHILSVGNAVLNNAITPVFATPDQFQYYYKSNSSTNSVVYEVSCSTDPTFATGVTIVDTRTATTTAWTASPLIDLSAYSNIYVRIQVMAFPTGNAAALFIDDMSCTSRVIASPPLASQNRIIVPDVGNSTCGPVIPVTVPAAASGRTLSFYDQGGFSDTYNKGTTQILYFAPATAGEKVKLTFNSFLVDQFINGTIPTNITVYNGNGTTAGTEFTGLNAVTTVSPGTAVTSSDASGYITVKFVTTNSATALNATNHPGFDATVECVGSPTITGLTGSGCTGGPLVITGTNLGGATVVTVGGVAVSAIGANTATSLTVTPAAGSSGTVYVSTPAGNVTSVGTYTVNLLPTISSPPSSGTQLICLNGASTALSVTAAAGSGSIAKYEWYSNTTASTTGSTLVATNTTAATTNTYTPLTTALGTLYYYVVVSNSNGCTVTSAFTGGITINAPVVITAQPSTAVQTVCVGSPITTLSVTATGGGLSYQWYSNTVNSNVGGTSLGVTAVSSTYTPSNASAMATTYYYCVVSNGAPCSSAVTSAVSGAITVNAVPTTVIVSSAGTFCTNTTLTAVNGGSGTMYFQGTTSGGTSTATPATSQLVNASGTYYFRAFNGSCWSTEGAAAVTIVAVPGTPATIAPSAITANSFAGSWPAVAGATGYYLDVSTNVGFTAILPAYSNLSLGNVLTYTVTGLNPSTQYFYRVRAFNGTCSGPSSTNFQNCTTLGLTYCLPSGSGFSQDPLGITNVTMGTINNTTGIEATNYGNYTGFSTSVFVGATQPFSVTYRTGYTYDTTVWVDWNNDGDFGDVGELVYQGNSTNAVPTTLSGSFAVPLLNSDGVSTVGSHRVRIGGIDFGPLTDPCRANSWQAFEDYTLNVVTVPPCAVSTPSALTTVNVVAAGASLVWSDPAMTPNTVYNYWVSTTNTAPPADGTDPAGMGTVTGALSANVSGLNLGVTYYFWVRVKCSAVSYSAWVGSATFTTANLDVVNMTGGSISTCNAKFYDSGSFSGSYSNNENSTYTFTSASSTNLKVVFNSFVTEPGFDFLSIYDGPNVGSTLLGTFSGSQIAAGQAFYSSGTSLTFRFTSDISITPAGWDANITCVNVPTVTSFSPVFACVGSTPVITLTGTNFTGASAVTFNGVAATTYSVNGTGTTITATLPVGATTGVIRVTTPTASGVSTASFAVRPIPATPNAGADVVFCNGGSTTLNISVPPASNTLATTQLGGNGCNGGNMFNIVTGPSPVSITSFDITPNSSGVQSVNVYYRTGTYVGNETTTGAWTLLGTYSVNGVAKVLVNMPVTALPLLASTTYGIYINYDASYTDGTNSYTNGEITINTGAGLCALFGSVNASRTFNGVVNYQVTATPTYTWTPATGLSSTTIVNPVASPTSTTTYNVTTTINGCTSASDSVVVTVNPVPTTSIPTASANVCANSVIPVTVSGSATTYTWTSSVANTLFTDATGLTAYVAGSNTTAIYVKTPTTATITATGTILPGGCFTTAAVTFTVVTKTFNAPFWNPSPPVSDGTENIVFNAGNYSSTADLSACSCTVNGATANVTFNSGHTLSLVNGLTVSAGAVTFNSGASLVQTNPVANIGNITYKRDSTPCFKNDYTYWSSPVAGQTLIGLSPATGSTGFFDYNAGVNSWQQTPYASVMSLGKGYLIRVPSSYPVAPALPTNFTANFIGVPNNGTIPVGIVYNPANALNLIGNPYPSAINAAALVTDPVFNVNGSFLGGTIYLWSHNSNVNYVTGQYDQTDYAVWNILGGVNTYYTGFVGSGNSNAPTGTIGAGQGFFIKTVATGTAYFRNTMRTGGATNLNNIFYRTNSSSDPLDPTADYEKHRIWLDVNNGVQAYKQLLVGYVEGGTDGLDRLFDGEMVDNGNTVSLYTTVETKKLSIQGRGLTFTPNDTFALGFKTTVADSYSINLSDFDGLFTNQNIYLEDTVLHVIHDLKVSPYAFSSAVGVFEDRFVLRFTNATLGTTTPVFNENSVVVYKNEEGLFINTGSENMKNAYIYDIRGRLLASQKQVGKSSTVFSTLPSTQQVLLVKIEGENGGTVTKKIVF